ncbi:MAG TPA: thioredoxin family protein [Vicinamibacteria bacterium]|nr:thioredoxin family protein [Vicinamibacteria bacterium]
MIAGLAITVVLAAGAHASAPPSTPASIHWEKNFDDALRKARKAGKPVIVDFWAEWCSWCIRLDHTTYVDPLVVRKAQDFVAVKVDTEGSPKDVDVARRYWVETLPCIVFLSPQGRQLWRVRGYQGEGVFPRTLDSVLVTARRVMAMEDALLRNPDDPRALAGLGAHLYEVGTTFYQNESLDEAREMLGRAAQRDGEEAPDDRRRTRMLLAVLENLRHNFAEAERLVKEALSLGPQGEEEPKLLLTLGLTYRSWGREDEAVRTLEIIVQQYPQSPIAQKARETLTNLKPR